MRVVLKDTLTNEQKNIVLHWLKKEEKFVKEYYQMMYEDNNSKTQLYFTEAFSTYHADEILLNIEEDKDNILIWAMYDSFTEYIFKGTPLLSIKELKELHGLV